MAGERFRVARARMGMTLRDVAGKCGVTPQAALKWEQGKANPASKALLAFCNATDVSVEWLMAPEPLDFRSTDTAPQGRHAKYWVREALDEIVASPRIATALADLATKEAVGEGK